MNQMRADPRCGDCLRALAANAVRLAMGKEERIRGDETREEVLALLEEGLAQGWTSPVIANRMLREITRRSGNEDPYAAFKERELAGARAVFASVAPKVGSDLRSRIGLAVLGNTLDFFRDPDVVLEEVPALLREGVRFERDDIARLDRCLDGRPERVLYLTDNTGFPCSRPWPRDRSSALWSSRAAMR